MNELKCLCEPLQVGPLSLNNRMVRAPMHSFLSWESGEVSQQLIDLYEHSARNGISLIIVEETAVDGRHTGKTELRIDERRFEPGLRRLVEVIHSNIVPAAIQLCHRGMLANDPISPSGVSCYGPGRTSFVQPRAMSLEEIEETRNLFIAAAVRAMNLGFDGVVLHGATAYLLEQFVSPHTNHRIDKYGGNFEKRCAMPKEILQGIRDKCDDSLAIGYSMVGDELLPDGITLRESVAFAKVLESQGVNWLDLRIGTYETSSSDPRGGISYRQQKGIFEMAETIKKSVSIPVFVSCAGEHDPIRWEKAIEAKQCDAIQLARSLLCDPELPKKVSEGRLDDIRPCIRCNYCLETGTVKGWQVSCALNPELGRERDYALHPISGEPKTVLIVGGGPGGLQSARIAALRGHKVILWEKERETGGNLRVAALPPGKQHYQDKYGDWLERQCRKAGVKIELKKEASAHSVKKLEPDVVIVATGATPFIPAISGINMPRVVTASDVLTRKVIVGKEVVIIGGGEVGVETADFITHAGMAEKVTILEMLPKIASDMTTHNRTYLLTSVLPKASVNMHINMRVDAITNAEVMATDKEGKTHSFKADTVIIAVGYKPNTSLYHRLKGEVPELYRIGDCVKARNIAEAVREGWYTSQRI